MFIGGDKLHSAGYVSIRAQHLVTWLLFANLRVAQRCSLAGLIAFVCRARSLRFLGMLR